MESGSILENMKLVQEGQRVWMRVGMLAERVVEGIIFKITDIDRKGFANTRIHIKDNQGVEYISATSETYDHPPQKVKITDEYGPVSVWR